MKKIFQSECLRFRRWALGLMTLHLGYWAITWNVQTGQGVQPKFVALPAAILVAAIASILTGLAFGVIHMGLHKRANHWTWLIHRPIHHARIFAGLVSAGALLLASVCLLPWLLYVLGLDLMTSTVVDLRHYLNGLYFFFLGYGAYLTGCIGTLSPKKGLFLVGSMLLFVFGHALGFFDHAPGSSVIFYLTSMVVTAWLLTLCYNLFKPDLNLLPRSKTNLVLGVIPMQFSISFGLLIAVTVLYLGKLHFTNPNPYQEPPEGTQKYVELLDDRDRAAHYLREVQGPEAEYLRNQVKLGDINFTSAVPLGYPVRHQMLFQDRADKVLVDRERGSYWLFSHHQMLLKGLDLKTHKTRGWIGVSGFKNNSSDFEAGERFPSVPHFNRGNLLQLPRKLLWVDFENRKVVEKHAVDGDEFYYSKFYSGPNYLSVSTNENLYLFERVNEEPAEARWEPDYVVPHPRPVRNISHIVTFKLIDGYLAKYGNDYFYGAGRPGLMLLRLKRDRPAQLITQKEYSEFVDPAYIRFGIFSLSPLVFALHENVFWRLIEPNERRHVRFEVIKMRLPMGLMVTIGLIHLLCIGVAWLACKRTRLDVGGKTAWLVLVALFGLPGLVNLLLLRERPDGAR